MMLHPIQFLDLEAEYTTFEDAAVCILPFPYEGGISYLSGTANAPDAVLEASKHLECYDEILKAEPYRMGIATIHPPEIPHDKEKIIEAIYHEIQTLMKTGKFVVLLGGDHSITTGYVRVLHERHPGLSVIQLDAHADLRDSYNGSKFNHACIMARLRDMSVDTLQLGIRSLSREEAERVEEERLKLYSMHDYRQKMFDLGTVLDRLSDPVYITLDVDVFDWGVIRSTGTPEPGGFSWDEGMSLLHRIFSRKQVVGFDVVELSFDNHDYNSPFAVAKLIYKMLGFISL